MSIRSKRSIIKIIIVIVEWSRWTKIENDFEKIWCANQKFKKMDKSRSN